MEDMNLVQKLKEEKEKKEEKEENLKRETFITLYKAKQELKNKITDLINTHNHELRILENQLNTLEPLLQQTCCHYEHGYSKWDSDENYYCPACGTEIYKSMTLQKWDSVIR
jgi:hypothetical protein